MSEQTLEGDKGRLDALVERLRAHAEAHEYIANADPEQKQWMNDLYDAADEIERLNRIECAARRLVSELLTQQNGERVCAAWDELALFLPPNAAELDDTPDAMDQCP